ncbi:MAG: response regulator [Planctomycetota bacterium]
MNILVIDDEPLILNLLKRTISQSGHSVSLAKNGAEALALVKTQNFDLILTDMWLADSSALELLNQLKNFCLKIVLMSGSYPQDTLQNHKEISHVLMKPFSIKDILAILQEIQRQLPILNPSPRITPIEIKESNN